MWDRFFESVDIHKALVDAVYLDKDAQVQKGVVSAMRCHRAAIRQAIKAFLRDL